MSGRGAGAPRRRPPVRVWAGLLLVAAGLVGATIGGTLPLTLGALAAAVGLILLLWRVGRGPGRVADPDDPRDVWDAMSRGEDLTDR